MRDRVNFNRLRAKERKNGGEREKKKRRRNHMNKENEWKEIKGCRKDQSKHMSLLKYVIHFF